MVECWVPRPHPEDTKESAMTEPMRMLHARAAILAVAEIKTATDAFERGDTNVFEALEIILAAVEAYRTQQDSEWPREAA
jgi:hypothetical protein